MRTPLPLGKHNNLPAKKESHGKELIKQGGSHSAQSLSESAK